MSAEKPEVVVAESSAGSLLKIPEAEIQKRLNIPDEMMEKFDAVMLRNDYSLLTTPERSQFVRMLCLRAGLAPDLNPIELLDTGNGLRPYMNKGAAEQLRAIHGLNAEITEKTQHNGSWIVSVRISGPDGRFEDEVGSGSLSDPKGLEKAFTRAKRRGSLAYCGMGALDVREDESDSGGPRRVNPTPVDQGSRLSLPPPVAATPPSVPVPQGNGQSADLPDPTIKGATPPVAMPVVARPKRG